MKRHGEGRTGAIRYETTLTRSSAISIIWNRNPIERLLRRRLPLSDSIDRLEPPRNDAPVGNLVMKHGCVVVSVIARGSKDVKH